MSLEYNEHYQLQEALAAEPALVPAPKLYNNDIEAIYSAMLARLAEPLPDGTPSPFSSPTPGSMQSNLVSVMCYMHDLMGHEINLVPDRAWVHFYRMLGVEILLPEFPIINLTFSRNSVAIGRSIPVEIPANTQVRSRKDATLTATTLETYTMTGEQTSIVVPAKLNRLGITSDIRSGDFTNLPQLLSFVDSVTNEGNPINSGRNKETLPEAMLRARYEVRTQRRCVTARDYAFWTLRLGASKANVVPRLQPDTPGLFNDLVTLVVYPPERTEVVRLQIEPMRMADSRLLVIPARVLVITGQITIRVVNEMSEADARSRSLEAIRREINPPAGSWGDQTFINSLASALERIQGVFAMPSADLYVVFQADNFQESRVPLAQVQIDPWNLFSVRQDIQIVVER